MNTFINDKSSEMVVFKGTQLVHQLTSSAYSPNNLTIRSLSCFCKPDGCDYYKLGSIHHQTELSAITHSTRLNTSTLFKDSEDDNIPLSTYMKNINNLPKLNSNLSTPGVSGYPQQQSRYSNGNYVLVKYFIRKQGYHYAAIYSSVEDEDGELRLTLIKICNENGTLFKFDERNVSDVLVEQIIKKSYLYETSLRKEKRVF